MGKDKRMPGAEGGRYILFARMWNWVEQGLQAPEEKMGLGTIMVGRGRG